MCVDDSRLSAEFQRLRLARLGTPNVSKWVLKVEDGESSIVSVDSSMLMLFSGGTSVLAR